MSLLERSKNLSKKITEIGDLNERGKQAKIFEQRANSLKLPAEALGKFTSVIDIFIANNIPILSLRLKRDNLGALRARIVDLRGRYTENKNVMMELFPNEDARYVLFDPLTKLPTEVGKDLLADWSSWTTLRVPVVNDDVLTILGKVSAFNGAVTKILGYKTTVGTICNELPTQGDEVARLDTVSGLISLEWSSLTGGDIHQEVLDFLKEVSSREGATFNDLMKEEVLAWLDKQNLRGALRIRMG
jgi:hypothetical protein